MITAKTLHFLTDLTKNNNKAWFESHKADYLEAKENFESFITGFLKNLSAEEAGFGLLQAKNCIFRIYRDVRFSKNKTPYKDHLAAGINKGGKRVHVPGYHLHIAPGHAFFAGGIWRPEAEMLAKVRQEIDYNFDEFSGILKKVKASKLFDVIDDEEALTRPPKGYAADNPAIEFIKMKSFILVRSFTDKQIIQKDFLENLMKSYQTLKPFVSFIERSSD